MREKIFDMHCDTILEMMEREQGVKKNTLHLDLERMAAHENYIQVFAAFIDQKGISVSPMTACVAMLHKIHEEIEKNKDRIRLIQSEKDLKAAAAQNGCGAILSIEGAEALEGSLSNLWMYDRLGVRLITLTWNYANELADGITESRGGGLTDFGRQAAAMMEDMGILVDVSHLSRKGFWDVAAVTKHPFVASHSCVYALCQHPRNLDDEQIRLLIDRGGGIGMNFYPQFLSYSGSCGIDTILSHMEYILDRGGDQTLGLGSDFDGVDALPDGIRGAENMQDLIDAMRKRRWPKELIERVCFGNFYRIFAQTLARRK